MLHTGFEFQVSGFDFRVLGFEFRVQSSGFRVQGVGIGIQDLGIRVCMVQEVRLSVRGGAEFRQKLGASVQGYLAHKKRHPPRTLQ